MHCRSLAPRTRSLTHSLQMVSLASSFEGRCFNRLCSPLSLPLPLGVRRGPNLQQPARSVPGRRRRGGAGAGARAHVCEMDLFHSISHGGRGGRAGGRTRTRRAAATAMHGGWLYDFEKPRRRRCRCQSVITVTPSRIDARSNVAWRTRSHSRSGERVVRRGREEGRSSRKWMQAE